MDLRPELTPPTLDAAVVERLARLADRLDGCLRDHAAADLELFNRVAGTAFAFEQFQGIYGAEDHARWVSRILYRQRIRPAHGVTRAELIEIIRRSTGEGVMQEEQDAYREILDANAPGCNGSNLLFYPPDYDAGSGTWGGGKPLGAYDSDPEQVADWILAARPAVVSGQ